MYCSYIRENPAIGSECERQYMQLGGKRKHAMIHHCAAIDNFFFNVKVAIFFVNTVHPARACIFNIINTFI